MKYCAKCGAACEDGFEFCPACGTEIPQVVAPASTKVCEKTEENVCECKETTPEVKEEVCAPDEVAKEEVTCEEVDSKYADYFKPMPADGKGKCTAGFSLALGLISLLFFWIPVVNVVMFVFSILGIIFASAAMKHYKYGAAIAGKTLSIFALVFNIILVGIFAIAVVTKYCYFEGIAATWKFYSSQSTSLINNVGKFLSSILLVK